MCLGRLHLDPNSGHSDTLCLAHGMLSGQAQTALIPHGLTFSIAVWTYCSTAVVGCRPTTLHAPARRTLPRSRRYLRVTLSRSVTLKFVSAASSIVQSGNFIALYLLLSSVILSRFPILPTRGHDSANGLNIWRFWSLQLRMQAVGLTKPREMHSIRDRES